MPAAADATDAPACRHGAVDAGQRAIVRRVRTLRSCRSRSAPPPTRARHRAAPDDTAAVRANRRAGARSVDRRRSRPPTRRRVRSGVSLTTYASGSRGCTHDERRIVDRAHVEHVDATRRIHRAQVQTARARCVVYVPTRNRRAIIAIAVSKQSTTVSVRAARYRVASLPGGITMFENLLRRAVAIPGDRARSTPTTPCR